MVIETWQKEIGPSVLACALDDTMDGNGPVVVNVVNNFTRLEQIMASSFLPPADNTFNVAFNSQTRPNAKEFPTYEINQTLPSFPSPPIHQVLPCGSLRPESIPAGETS